MRDRYRYRFRKDKIMKDGKISWRCVTLACYGRLRVGVTDDVISSTDHNHEPELGRNEIGKVDMTVEKLQLMFHQTSLATSSTVTSLHTKHKP